MFIPIIPAASDENGDLYASHVTFSGVVPESSGEHVGYKKLISGMISDAESKMPIAVMDVDGLREKTINNILLKKMRARGAQIWFMTCVETVDDIFDAFNTDADMVLMPYHCILSEHELRDILSVSDSAVPTLFVRHGKAQCFGKTASPVDLVEKLSDMGFGTVAVFDLTGDMTDDDWRMISISGRVLPYSVDSRKEPFFSELGMEWCFRSIL